jgi:hypothetical protein
VNTPAAIGTDPPPRSVERKPQVTNGYRVGGSVAAAGTLAGMGRKLIVRGAVLAAVLVAGACSSDGAKKIEVSTAGSPSATQPSATGSSAPATTSPTMPSQAQGPSQLPMCSDVAAADRGQHTDCRLQSADTAGLSFEVRHATSDHGTTVTVDVNGRDGRHLQTITEAETDTPAEPRLQDLDGDGRDELIVPRELFVVGNVEYAIYHVSGTEFTRSGIVLGREIASTASGYVASSAHVSAIGSAVGFWKFEGAQLRPVVTASIDPVTEEDGTIVAFQCTITDDGGLAGTGLSADQARQKFCNEPIVVQATPVK